MANTKITNLASLTAASGDEIPVNRSGADGKVTAGDIAALARERLTSHRIYYVRKDGSDSNTGLVDNAGGAFLTISKAMDVVGILDIGNAYTTESFPIKVLVGAGTYDENVDLPFLVGTLPEDETLGIGGLALLEATSGVASDVIITRRINSCHTFGWLIGALTVSVTNGTCIRCVEMSLLRLANTVIVGNGDTHGFQIYDHSELYCMQTVTMSGAFLRGIDLLFYSQFFLFGDLVMSGTPSFSITFLRLKWTSTFENDGGSIIGDATGTCFQMGEGHSHILTPNNGNDLSELPGDVTGILEANGEYNNWPGPPVLYTAVTYANLLGPTAGLSKGQMAWVSDSSTATWGATIAGGGANSVLAVWNGTNWTVAGK